MSHVLFYRLCLSGVTRICTLAMGGQHLLSSAQLHFCTKLRLVVCDAVFPIPLQEFPVTRQQRPGMPFLLQGSVNFLRRFHFEKKQCTSFSCPQAWRPHNHRGFEPPQHALPLCRYLRDQNKLWIQLHEHNVDLLAYSCEDSTLLGNVRRASEMDRVAPL